MGHLLEVKGVTKIYEGGVLVSHSVNFTVGGGEIRALVGENGAGKSTLMKVLYGLGGITSSHIYLNGKELKLQFNREAIKRGTSMVHRHFILVGSLTRAENMMLGLEETGFVSNKERDILITDEVARKYNFETDVSRRARDMSVGMKQRLEVLEILYHSAELIILDEPTAVLTLWETKELFERLMEFKERGITIIFISRKLSEVKHIGDRITVLEDGVTKETYLTKDVSEEDISNLMVGRETSFEYDKARVGAGEVVLKARNLTYVNRFKIPKLSGVSIEVRKDEIVGIIGVRGNGQSELISIITGNVRALEGRIFFGGQDITNEFVTGIRKIDISHVPEGRMIEGYASEMSLQENLIVSNIDTFANKSGMMENVKVREHCRKQIHEFMVKAKDENQFIDGLSGGNIQEAIAAREFMAPSDLFVSNQPTRGVNAGVIPLTHSKILEMRSHSKAILLSSADLNELVPLSDRTFMMHKGKIMGALSNAPKVAEQELGLYMLGLKRQEGLGQIMENKDQNKKPLGIVDHFSVMQIVATLLLSILLVFIIISLVGQTPGLAIQKLMLGPLEIKGSSFNAVVRVIPLVFTGLELTLCLKNDIFNTSSDASFYMGVVVATAVAVACFLPDGLHQLALILATAVVGGVISILPVVVDKCTKVNPVVLAIMANSILYYFGLSIISSFFPEKSGSWESYKLPDHARLRTVTKGAILHYGFVVVIAVILFVIFLMDKTSSGYKVRAMGSNPTFTKASSIKTGFVVLMAQFIGGAIVDIGGAIEIVGVYKRFQWQSRTVYVWDGLLIYMLVNGNPTFISLIILFIVCLRVGVEVMSRSADLDPEIIIFLQGVIILLVAFQRFLHFLKQRHGQKMSPKQAEAEEGGAAA